MSTLGRIASAILLLLAAGHLNAPAQDTQPYGRHQFEPQLREHWSFQPLARPEIPAGNTTWPLNPIDQFVWAGLQQAGLPPTAPPPRAVLLRRVHLDLIGLPPTPAELDAFLADTRPTAFESVVDDLLARPQYGERWARHWLDVVRYAETNGYERDGLKPHAWRYRDWVIEALNADLPYDQFLTQQLAGDEIDGSDVDSQVATTMLRLGPWDDEPADPLTDRFDQLDDIVAATSATFVGLTLRCARCHDHKFEPFSQHDYTRWLAIFAPLKRPQKERNDLDRDLGPHDRVDAYQQLVKQLDGQKNELENKLRTLEWQVAARSVGESVGVAAPAATGATTTSSPAEALATSKGIPAEAVAALAIEPAKRSDQQKKMVSANSGKLKELARELATDAERGQFAESEQHLTATRAKYPAPLPKGYIWYEEGTTCDASHVLRRGDPRNQGDEVAPGFPAILVDGPPAPPQPTARSTGRRLQLARWLTRGDHPLTARVMVNRLWQHHFGEGIVASENDFGVMGSPPSNQALLDWLASEFVAGGWQIKRMHRLMVLSQTYQMASTGNSAAETVDPSGAMLWRFRPQRLEAEALRDTILVVSGQLNPAARPGIYPKISQAVLETQSKPGDGWRTSDPVQAARRSVYVFVKRTLLVPELEVLDFPSTEETCEQRVVSTVAPQALTFLNGEFVNEQALALAGRLVRDAGGQAADRIVRAYRLAFSRLPTDNELASLLAFLQLQQAQIERDSAGKVSGDEAALRSLAALCLVLFNTNEFAYVQ